MGITTLDEASKLYDSILAARGDIGSYAGGRGVPDLYYRKPPTLDGPYDLSKQSEHERMWQDTLARREAVEQIRIAPPLIRLHDGDYNLRGVVAGWKAIDYQFIENDTGTASIKLSLSHYLAKWVMNFRGRNKRNVHVTIDKQGARWSGSMDHYKVVKTQNKDRYLEIVFKHDYENCKHIYCWANPFLRPEVQFPKLWTIFGPAKWCLMMTMFVNILRLETSLWTLPDNPLDINEWMGPSFNPGTWRNIVKPFPFLADNSNISIVFSRFKTWHDAAKATLADAQLTVVARRYLKDDDPHPFSDLAGELNNFIAEDIASLIPLRNGCLVWDIVDNSGWGEGTAFGGSLLVGLVRAVVNIAGDGYTESVDVFTGDPTSPSEYYNPLFLGTNPKYPWVIFEDGNRSGVESAEFTYYEATSTSFLTGGHSMPGVNEGISAGINMAGDFLTSLINSFIGMSPKPSALFATVDYNIDIPPLGGVMDAVAQILYKDTFLAFEEVPTLRAVAQTLPIAGLENLLSGLGDFHYYEDWSDGADKAFTLAAQMAIRAKIWATRARSAHSIKVADASPYIFGERGYGHFGMGNRVGTTVLEYPVPDTVFVERLSKARYRWDENGSKGWEFDIGYKEAEDPAFKAIELVKEVNGALSTFGIL